MRILSRRIEGYRKTAPEPGGRQPSGGFSSGWVLGGNIYLAGSPDSTFGETASTKHSVLIFQSGWVIPGFRLEV